MFLQVGSVLFMLFGGGSLAAAAKTAVPAAQTAVKTENPDIVLSLGPGVAAAPQTKAASFPTASVQQTAQPAAAHQTAGVKFAPSAQAAPIEGNLWRKAHQKGFFVLHFTNKFFAHDAFEFDGRDLSLGFGAQFWRGGEMELNMNLGRTTPSFGLKYSHPFAEEGETWIPGADASFLLGLIDEKDREYRELLAVGAGAGLFLKTFVSEKYALIARTGLSFSVPVNGSLWDEAPKIYISAGFKRYFN